MTLTPKYAPKANDQPYARYVLRHFSRPLVPVALKLGLSPNSISIASILTGLIALVYLVRGTLADDLIGLLILQFSLILDCLDGDLARARQANAPEGSANIGGVYLDYSRELIIPPLIHFSLAVGLHNVSPALPLVYLAAASSMLKLAPQLAKEHTVIAQLRKADSAYLEALQNGPVLQDSFSGMKKRTTPLALALRLAKSVFGFPAGLTNSMMVIVAVGWFYGFEIYIIGKTALLWTATGLYLLNFLVTYGQVFQQLRQVPPGQDR